MSDVGYIFFTILIVLGITLLGALFLFLIRHNMRKDKEASEVIVENAITKKAMEESISGYIKKVDRFGALALMYIDIDGFADLNEVFGRDTCDELLKEIANRILRALPYKASLCRYENDEFLVFIKDDISLI